MHQLAHKATQHTLWSQLPKSRAQITEHSVTCVLHVSCSSKAAAAKEPKKALLHSRFLPHSPAHLLHDTLVLASEINIWCALHNFHPVAHGYTIPGTPSSEWVAYNAHCQKVQPITCEGQTITTTWVIHTHMQQHQQQHLHNNSMLHDWTSDLYIRPAAESTKSAKPTWTATLKKLCCFGQSPACITQLHSKSKCWDRLCVTAESAIKDRWTFWDSLVLSANASCYTEDAMIQRNSRLAPCYWVTLPSVTAWGCQCSSRSGWVCHSV